MSGRDFLYAYKSLEKVLWDLKCARTNLVGALYCNDIRKTVDPDGLLAGTEELIDKVKKQQDKFRNCLTPSKQESLK